MKTLRLLSVVSLAAGFVTAALFASPSESAAPSANPKLQVSVAVPDLPGRTMAENTYASQLFATTLAKTLKRQGYPREVEVIRSATAAKSGTPYLNIQLVEWRSTIPGEMYCAFDATLADGDTRSDLGRFSASERIGFDQDHAMKTVAAAAVKKLGERLGAGAPVAAQ